MLFSPVTTKEDIKKGDLILIDNGSGVQAETVKTVLENSLDGVEIIIDKKKNKYFNLKMYLSGESWVKELFVVSRGTDDAS